MNASNTLQPSSKNVLFAKTRQVLS